MEQNQLSTLFQDRYGIFFKHCSLFYKKWNQPLQNSSANKRFLKASIPKSSFPIQALCARITSMGRIAGSGVGSYFSNKKKRPAGCPKMRIFWKLVSWTGNNILNNGQFCFMSVILFRKRYQFTIYSGKLFLKI